MSIEIRLSASAASPRRFSAASNAFGLSRTTVRGSRVVLFIVLGAMIFSPGMIPSFLVVKELGLINTYPALILPGLLVIILPISFFFGTLFTLSRPPTKE